MSKKVGPGILKGESIIVLFDWFGFVCSQIKTKIVSFHTADFIPVREGQWYSDTYSI
jgi:hypothetical protein